MKTLLTKTSLIAFLVSLAGALFVPREAVAIDHSPQWYGATSLTYGLTDLDDFAVKNYRYCKWGNMMDSKGSNVLGLGEQDLDFNRLCLPFYNPDTLTYSITGAYSAQSVDLFLSNDSDSYLSRVAFPAKAEWGSTYIDPITSVGWLYNDRLSNVRLYRYLHFRNTLKDASNIALTGNETKLIILFHGLNPSALTNAFSGSSDAPAEFAKLVNNIKTAIAGTDWKLVLYHWEADAATITAYENANWYASSDYAVNATESAEISHQHGQHLGEVLAINFRNLKKVHVIAHSAGSWAARGTLRYLLNRRTDVWGQLTLLDPFMPNAIVGISSSLGASIMSAFDELGSSQLTGLDRLENYYADDTGIIQAYGTQETFSWGTNNNPHKNLRVDHGSYFQNHPGPITFYNCTVQFSRTRSDYSPPTAASLGLSSFLVDYKEAAGEASRPKVPDGWNNSLFMSEILVDSAPVSQTVERGKSVTFTVTATTRLAQTYGVSAPATLQYKWYKGTTLLSTTTTNSYKISSTKTSDDGDDYFVIIEDKNRASSCAQSETFSLSVAVPVETSKTPEITAGGDLPATSTPDVNGNLFLVVSASGTPVPSYQWEKNTGSGWRTIAGETNAFITLSGLSLANNGTQYRCKISNGVGAAIYSAVTTITNAPNNSTGTGGGNDGDDDDDDSDDDADDASVEVTRISTYALTVKGARLNTIIPTPLVTDKKFQKTAANRGIPVYTWKVKNKTTGNMEPLYIRNKLVKTTVKNVTVKEDGFYRVDVVWTAVDGKQKSASREWDVTLTPVVSFDRAEWLSINYGTTGTTPTVKGVAVWNGVVIPNAENVADGAVEEVAFVAKLNSAKAPTVPVVFKWYDGTKLLYTSEPTSSMTSTLVFNSNGTAGAPILTAKSKIRVIAETEVRALNSKGIEIPTKPLSIAKSKVFSVRGIVPPAVSIQTSTPGYITAVVGKAFGLSARVTGTAPFTFRWLKDGEEISGANKAVFTKKEPTVADAGRYTVVVTNAAGESYSASATIEVRF